MKFLVALFCLFLGAQSAQAGLLIEPLVGYSLGGKLGDDDKTNGPSLGGRLGYQALGLQLGLDYLQSVQSIDASGYDDYTSSEFGAFVGYEFPILLRAYAGYIFSATGETKLNTTKYEFIEGTGTKFGVGFTGLPFVVINLEYRNGEYGDYKLNGVKQSDTVKFSSYLLSLSLPINL